MSRTVKELLSSIDSKELTEWEAFYSLEPFGPQVDNLNAALAPSILVNVNRKENAPTVKPEDMAFGEFESTVKVQSLEEQKAMIELIGAAFGAKKVKRETDG